MTTRQKLDALLDRLSDPELEAEYARLLREREVDRRIVASYEQTPQHQSDGWADLRAVNEVARDAVLDRLDAEARLNRQPW
jgi:hypothetical protein